MTLRKERMLMVIVSCMTVFLSLSASGMALAEQDDLQIPGAFLGVSLVDFTDEYQKHFGKLHPVEGGIVRIRAILPGTAAFRSDLRIGDLLIMINGKAIPRKEPVQAVINMIRSMTPEDTVALTGFRLTCRVWQDGAEMGSHEVMEPLWALLDRPGKWSDTTIAKKVTVSSFEQQVQLGSRATFEEGRDLPASEMFLARLKKKKTLVNQELFAETGFEEISRESAKAIGADAAGNLPGITIFESVLHRSPESIEAVADMVGRDLFVSDYAELLRRIAGYVAENPINDPAFPALPATKDEAVSQLFDFVDRKRQLEKMFLIKGSDPSRARDILGRLYMAYHGGQVPEELLSGNDLGLRSEIFELESVIDYGKIIEAGLYLLGFFSEERLQVMRQILANDGEQTISKEDMVIRLGGTGDDHFSGHADLVIDFGGNDAYLQFGQTQHMPIIIDFSGDDIYQSAVPFALGSGMLEASLVLDLEGNDVYLAESASLGLGIGGIGIVLDSAGDDLYTANHTSMGVGLFGFGLLFDSKGNDRYVSGYRSQGVGLAGGLGMVRDGGGDDSYASTGGMPSSYKEEGLFDGFSQGAGFGLRGISRGGVGILADLAGNDFYRSGNFSQGTGYYFGSGILVDYSGDDSYRVSRYGIGAAAHSASGLFVDFDGDDLYKADVQAICGAAWDLSTAFFRDVTGNDRYESEQHFSFGAADHNGYARHHDSNGNDAYGHFFYAVQTNSYHGGKSSGLLINAGGKDEYPEGYGDGQTRRVGEFLFIDSDEVLSSATD